MSAPAAVVDASVWVSSLTPGEVHHPISQHWLAAHLAAGGQVIAPTLLPVEVAAAITRRSGDPLLGEQGMDAMKVVMAAFRSRPPRELGGMKLARAAGRIALRTP